MRFRNRELGGSLLALLAAVSGLGVPANRASAATVRGCNGKTITVGGH